jgi:polyphosphate glucokinase
MAAKTRTPSKKSPPAAAEAAAAAHPGSRAPGSARRAPARKAVRPGGNASLRGAVDGREGKTRAGSTAKVEGKAPFTLTLDVGGTGIKGIVLDDDGKPVVERVRIVTPRPATPEAVVGVIEQIVKQMPAFDRVSVGFPGVVDENVVCTAPNLDGEWGKYPLGKQIEKIAKKPVRVLNDAGVQGYGVIEGKGVEMVLTFGTGMGTALFLDGKYVPNLELAHHPFKNDKTYEDCVRDSALKKIGKRKWNKRVREVIEQVLPIWNPRVLYLGGGNSRLIKQKLPEKVKVTENVAGLLGGIALWHLDG